VSCDLWNGDVGKLERETSSKHEFDLSLPLPLTGALHHGLGAQASSRMSWAEKKAAATSQL
jgi:hypothetical protein